MTFHKCFSFARIFQQFRGDDNVQFNYTFLTAEFCIYLTLDQSPASGTQFFSNPTNPRILSGHLNIFFFFRCWSGWRCIGFGSVLVWDRTLGRAQVFLVFQKHKKKEKKSRIISYQETAKHGADRFWRF